MKTFGQLLPMIGYALGITIGVIGGFCLGYLCRDHDHSKPANDDEPLRCYWCHSRRIHMMSGPDLGDAICVNCGEQGETHWFVRRH